MKRIAMAAMFLLAVSAQAQEAEADGGTWRIGAGAAFANYERDNGAIDDSSAGFKFWGQYQFNGWFGIEGAYLNTGDFAAPQATQGPSSSSSVEQAFSGFSVAGVFYLPLDIEDIDLYGKVGFFDFDTDLAEDKVTVASGSEDGALFGAGAAVGISEQFAVRAELDWYDVEEAELWSVNLGVEYRF